MAAARNPHNCHSLAEVQKLLPGKPHPSTIFRWIQRGVRGVKLQTKLVGGRRFVDDEALDDFLRLINEISSAPHDERIAATGPAHNLHHAESFLDNEGVK